MRQGHEKCKEQSEQSGAVQLLKSACHGVTVRNRRSKEDDREVWAAQRDREAGQRRQLTVASPNQMANTLPQTTANGSATSKAQRLYDPVRPTCPSCLRSSSLTLSLRTYGQREFTLLEQSVALDFYSSNEHFRVNGNIRLAELLYRHVECREKKKVRSFLRLSLHAVELDGFALKMLEIVF